MKKAQATMIYGLLVMVLGLIIFSSIFFLSDSIKKSSSEEMSIVLADTILAKVEYKILDAKAIAEFSKNEVNIIMELPQLLGNQKYNLVGGDESIRVRVLGETNVVRKRKIGSAISTSGVSFPPYLRINYNPYTDDVTIT